jgi:hypothetical protein
VIGLAGRQQAAAAERYRPHRQRASIAILPGTEGCAGRSRIQQIHPHRSSSGEVAFVSVVGPLLIVQIGDQLRNQKVQIGVALTVRVARQVDRHVIDLGCQIGAVIEIEGAKKVLIGFAFAGVLRHDQSRHVLEHRRRPQQRLARELLLADIAGRGGLQVADAGRHDGNRRQHRADVIAVVGMRRAAQAETHEHAGGRVARFAAHVVEAPFGDNTWQAPLWTQRPVGGGRCQADDRYDYR